MATKTLEAKMIAIGYSGLFLLGDDSLLDSIWDEGNNLKQLTEVIESESSSPVAIFLAAEVLRFYDASVDPNSYVALAEAYAYALKQSGVDGGNTMGLNGNLWGLLYEEDDPGYLGQQFIMFGNASLTPLKELLDDSSGGVLYEGSEEAISGNAYRFRIKDFAAFYISKITKIPVKFHQDFEERDREIERLRNQL